MGRKERKRRLLKKVGSLFSNAGRVGLVAKDLF
jgi:hypothetical protein